MKLKRIVSLVMVLVLLLSLCPVSAFATDSTDTTESTPETTEITEATEATEATESTETEETTEPTETEETTEPTEPEKTYNFVDECTDFSKVYSLSNNYGGWKLNTSSLTGIGSADTTHFARNITDVNAVEHLIYYLPNLQDFKLTIACFGNSYGTIKLYTSPDGEIWTEQAYTRTGTLVSQWAQIVFTPTDGVNAGANYLKIEFGYHFKTWGTMPGRVEAVCSENLVPAINSAKMVDDALVVSFNPVKDANSYTVNLSVDGEVVKSVQTEKTTCNIYGVTPGATYVATVTAHTETTDDVVSEGVSVTIPATTSFVDECTDFSKVYYLSNNYGGWKLSTSTLNGIGSADTTHIARNITNVNAVEHLIYYLPNLQDFKLMIACFGKSYGTIKLYTSPDGEIWTEQAYTRTGTVVSQWARIAFTPTDGVNTGANYLKIEFGYHFKTYGTMLGRVEATMRNTFDQKLLQDSMQSDNNLYLANNAVFEAFEADATAVRPVEGKTAELVYSWTNIQNLNLQAWRKDGAKAIFETSADGVTYSELSVAAVEGEADESGYTPVTFSVDGLEGIHYLKIKVTGDIYVGKTSFEYKPDNTPIQHIRFEDSLLSGIVGDDATPGLKLAPMNGVSTLLYSSDDTEIAEFNDGVVAFSKPGTTNLRVSVEGSGVEAVLPVYISKNMVLNPGDVRYLQYSNQVSSNNVTSIWSSSNEDVAVVTGYAYSDGSPDVGVITAKGIGDAVITLTIGDDTIAFNVTVEEDDTPDDIKLIKQRWIEYILPKVSEDAEFAELSARAIKDLSDQAVILWESMNQAYDGTYLWETAETSPDVVCGNQFSQLIVLVKAFVTEGTALYQNPEVGVAILNAMQYLTGTGDYAQISGSWLYNGSNSSGNWWYWELGVPMNFGPVLLMMESYLEDEEITRYSNLIARYCTIAEMNNHTGANACWAAQCVLAVGLLQNDESRIKAVTASTSSVTEAFIVKDGYANWSEGLYEDGSTIFHYKHAYTAGYGLSTLSSAAQFQYLLGGTQYNFEDSVTDAFLDFAIKGYLPMLYKGHFLGFTAGREVSRISFNELSKGMGAMKSLIELSKYCTDVEKKALIEGVVKHNLQEMVNYYGESALGNNIEFYELLADESVVTQPYPNGFTAYSAMCRYVQRNSNYLAGLALSRQHIASFESINKENFYAFYQGAGALYTYNDLEQFNFDFWVTRDPYRTTGVTADTTELQRTKGQSTVSNNQTASGATDGTLASIAYQFNASFLGLDTKARKSYFFLDKGILMMGTGISGTTESSIETTVEARILNEDGSNIITIYDAATKSTYQFVDTDEKQTIHLAAGSWIHLEGNKEDGSADMAYYFPIDTDIQIDVELRTGNGYTINESEASKGYEVSLYYLIMSINHGTGTVSGGKYLYMTLPSMSIEEISAYAENNTLKIVDGIVEGGNTYAHVIKDSNDTVTAVNYFGSGAYRVDWLELQDSYTSLLVTENEGVYTLSIADASYNASSLSVFSDYKMNVISKSDAITVAEDGMSFSVDTRDAGGQSFQMTFTLEDPVNIAQDKPVSFSTEQSGHEATYVNDGDTTTNWAGAVAKQFPEWVVIDLGESYKINQIDALFTNNNGNRAYYFDIMYSLDGVNFTTFITNSEDNTTGEFSYSLEAGTIPSETVARYIKVNVTGSNDQDTNKYTRPAIYEIEVYGAEVVLNIALNKPVTYSTQESANPASNVNDGDTTTRWAGAVAKQYPEWVTIDLGGRYEISQIDAKFFSDGGKRAYYFDIMSSVDGENFTTLITNSEDNTTGVFSYGLENGTIPSGTIARYIKINVTGANDQDTNQYTRPGICEIEVYGEAVPNIALNKPVTYSTQESANPASNVNDGDTTTRWAGAVAKQFPEWVIIDLEKPYKINQIDALFFNDTGKRAYYFDIMSSVDGENFTTFITNSEDNTTGVFSYGLEDGTIPSGTIARYIKINVTGANDQDTNQYTRPNIYEIQVYGESNLTTVAVALINAIGNVTVDSGDAIEAARTAYDALTDEEKLEVSNYETLTQAEERYAVLTSSKVESWNLILGDDIGLNFLVSVKESYVGQAYVNITVGDGEPVSYKVSDLIAEENGYYRFCANVAAAQMTENITVDVHINGESVLQKTYSVRDYAVTILNGDYDEATKYLVTWMINYGAAAQQYFGIKTDNLANAGYELTEAAVLPTEYEAMAINGSVEGIKFYGASLVFESKIAVRYYFQTDSVEGVSFTVNGTAYEAVAKNGMYYVEVAGINPQDYDKSIVLSVAKGEEILTVSYSPLNYIIRMSSKGDDSLQALVNALYGYHVAAVAYVTEQA